jgi:hypothetical protein
MCFYEKIPKVPQTTGTIDIFVRLQALQEPLRGELPQVQKFHNDGSNPLM